MLPHNAVLSSTRASAVSPLVLTTIAMLAFAANSILCRQALGTDAIDPFSFTTIRIGAGALSLSFFSLRRDRGADAQDWKRAGYLVLYALPFSVAYVALDTGTGALLLFGAVQITMIALGIRAGERPQPIEWLGLVGAAGGLLYLVFPGVTAPDPVHAGLMVAAGVGWGLYSIAGKGSGAPTAATAAAFRRAALAALPAMAVGVPWLSVSWQGALYAAVSGGITSGLGYAVWYLALRDLSATRAALVQLSVPVLAASGGVVLLSESVTLRLVVASVVILGSIAAGVAGRRQQS